jgi:hypothetical protein
LGSGNDLAAAADEDVFHHLGVRPTLVSMVITTGPTPMVTLVAAGVVVSSSSMLAYLSDIHSPNMPMPE